MIALIQRSQYRFVVSKSPENFEVRAYKKCWFCFYRYLHTDYFPQDDIYYGLLQYEKSGITFKQAIQNIFCDRLGYPRLKTTIILQLFKF